MGQLPKETVFALAVQKYSDAVYRAAVHNCSCTADAEDVVQDVFEKLLSYNGRFESEEHLKAWLLRVAINRCREITAPPCTCTIMRAIRQRKSDECWVPPPTRCSAGFAAPGRSYIRC